MTGPPGPPEPPEPPEHDSGGGGDDPQPKSNNRFLWVLGAALALMAAMALAGSQQPPSDRLPASAYPAPSKPSARPMDALRARMNLPPIDESKTAAAPTPER